MVECYRGKVPNTSKIVCERTLTDLPSAKVWLNARKLAETWEATKFLKS